MQKSAQCGVGSDVLEGGLKAAALVAVVVLLAACGETQEVSVRAPVQVADEAAGGVPAARIGTRVIDATTVDQALQLPLHDLDMQKYRLRRQALERQLLQELERRPEGERVAETLLEPPVPPRIRVDVDPNRVRPAPETAVTVLTFCNFESPHCARLQMVLEQVLPLFPGVVRYAERDLPLEFHRYAGKAGEAARCALEQGNYWRFHDFLYAANARPDRAALDRAARAASLEADAFGECLDSGRYAAEVAQDAELARSLGLSAVPAVFVNGSYASPPVQPADLVWLIEAELAVRNVASPRMVRTQTVSAVPFRLEALIASPVPGQGMVLMSPSVDPSRMAAFREGDLLTTGIVLRRIDSEGVELMRNGQVERLTPGVRPTPPLAATSSPSELGVMSPHRAAPVTLNRDQVLVLLSDRIALAEALQPVPMTTDGQRQLKVTAVEPGSLYELLGIEPGDVIVMVNEQPVTEASNPLWDALEKEGEVRVRVMRRGGLARHFTFRFEN